MATQSDNAPPKAPDRPLAGARAAFSRPLSGAVAFARRVGVGGAATGLAIRVGAAGLGYASQIVLARLLGSAEYGSFALAWLWVAIAGFAACLGYSQAAVRFLPAYDAQGETALAAGFRRRSAGVAVGLGAALAAVAIAVALVHPAAAGDLGLAGVVVAAVTVPVFAYQDMLEGFARGLGRIGLALAPPYIVRQGALLVIALGVVALTGAATAAMALAAGLAATVLATALQHVLVIRAMPAASGHATDDRAWLRASVPMFLTDGAIMLRSYADVLIVGALAPPETVAVYFAASRVAALLGFVEYAVGATAGPKLARASALKDRPALIALVRHAALSTLWPTLLGAVALALAAPLVLSLFGPGFAEGAPLVAILCCGYVVRAMAGPADDVLNMTGHERLAVVIQAGGLALAAILVPLLSYAHGITGAAVAMSIVTALTGLALLGAIRFALGRA